MTGGTATAYPLETMLAHSAKYRADREAAAEAEATRLDQEFVEIQKVYLWDWARLREWLHGRTDLEKEFVRLGKVPPWKR